MDLAIIVPARIASTRFPRKLLHEIQGRPLIIWTAIRIQQECPEMPLFFAVDHEDLKSVLKVNGFKTIMTREEHESGTDRIAEANAHIGAAHVINVQADEPLVTADQINKLSYLITSEGNDLATLAHPFKSAIDFQNPNQVKVVIDSDGHALYFSRATIPYSRNLGEAPTDAWVTDNPCYRHLGLYAYTADFLRAFSDLPQSPLEKIEKLEQLRALENGYTMAVGITDEVSVGIDSPEDVQSFERILKQTD